MNIAHSRLWIVSLPKHSSSWYLTWDTIPDTTQSPSIRHPGHLGHYSGHHSKSKHSSSWYLTWDTIPDTTQSPSIRHPGISLGTLFRTPLKVQAFVILVSHLGHYSGHHSKSKHSSSWYLTWDTIPDTTQSPSIRHPGISLGTLFRTPLKVQAFVILVSHLGHYSGHHSKSKHSSSWYLTWDTIPDTTQSPSIRHPGISLGTLFRTPLKVPYCTPHHVPMLHTSSK